MPSGIARLLGILGGVSCVIGGGVRCAHVEPPSGGPEDKTPPAVIAVYPAPDAVGVPARARAVFQFDEWIDRVAARNQVLISPPYRGRTRLEVDGNRLTVLLPGGGLRPNTTHTVTVLATLKDLRGNAMGREFALRFSTGSAIDSAAIGGSLALDGRRGQLVAALYRAGDRSGATALSLRDTGFRPAPVPEPWRELPAYLAAADSAGRFRLEGAAAGDYAFFAFEDVNGNFAFDPGLEAAATGPLSLPLRQNDPGRGAQQSLRLSPLDTLPLRIAEAAFAPQPEVDSAAEFLPGAVLVKFTRAAHPPRAAEAARYRILSDSGDPLMVRAVGWNTEKEAWALETPPLRANARHRVEMRGRPAFPGREDTSIDTSGFFTAERTAKPVEWILVPLRLAGTAGSSGLPRTAPSPLPGARQTFASSLPLTDARWNLLEKRMTARFLNDSLPLTFRARRIDGAALSLELSRPLRAGATLELRLPSAAGDSSPPRVLFSGKAPDSAAVGGLRLLPPADRRDWTFWLRATAGSPQAEHTLIRSRDSLRVESVPAGLYRLLAFRDRDGDGVWNPGALRPWIPQEPFETVLDTVRVTGGTVVDATGLLVP